MTIVVSQNGKDARILEKEIIDKENYLQEYIFNNPESVKIYDIKEDTKLLIVSREFPTNSGPIDALALDKYGNIYIIETKLYKNADKRKVVAQALDYGAALWKKFNDFNKFKSIISESVVKQFDQSLEDKFMQFFGFLEYDDTLKLLENARDNLDKGHFKFVILMDSVDERLKDLILFMNENSDFEIYCVELEYYKHDSYEIVIPKLYGAEYKKTQSKETINSTAAPISKNDFIEYCDTNVHERVERQVVDELLQFAESQADRMGWGRGKEPNFTFRVEYSPGKYITLFQLWAHGRINVYGWLMGGLLGNPDLKPYNEEIEKYFKEITAITGKTAIVNMRETQEFSYKVFSTPEKMNEFKKAVLRLKTALKIPKQM